MSTTNRKHPGKVYLVGAGPGDADLITVRGAECLGRADLVLYDYLANPMILRHAGRDAELVCLGRHGGDRIVPQEEIHARMIAAAGAGQTVVRLKSGDPAIFGRCAEETAALDVAGIAYEIVPGVTAALAAGSYAGIHLTHREHSSAVALVTGQEGDGKPSSAINYAALATFPGTLVFYMGVTTAPRWTKALVDGGKPRDTPAVIIRRCSWPDQTMIRCTLGEVAESIKQRKLRPPVIVIVGDVAGLQETTNWFTSRPLFGRKVMVTRPVHQAETLSRRLLEQGAEVVLQPAIQIEDPPDWRDVDAALTDLARFDWVVFSSANGVHCWMKRLLEVGGDLRRLGDVRLAAIGPGTADALAEYRLRADLVPNEYRAESLADELAQHAPRSRMLLIRASRGREVLADRLRAAGAEVEQVVVYRSTDVKSPERDVAAALEAGEIGWITVTSSAIARSLAAMFGDRLRESKLASLSPVTTATLHELGHAPAVEARQYTMVGLVEAIVEQA